MGSFNQAVTVSCTLTIATCNLTPSSTIYPTSTNPVNMTASVTVPLETAPGSYTATIQASTAGTSSLTASFTLVVTANPDFALTEPTAFPEVNAGSTGTTGSISIASQDGFSGIVTLNCPATYGAGSCSISPASVSSYPATATLTINGTNFVAGSYSLAVTGTSGSVTHTLDVPFNVGDYSISGTQSLSLAPGRQGTANLTLTSLSSYSGRINANCDATALSAAICTLLPANPITVQSGGSASLTATISVPNNAAIGTYDFNISTQDTTGAPNHAFSLSVVVGQDFLVTSSTASQSVQAGQTTGPYNLTVQPVGTSFNAAVSLACSGLPAYSQCFFNPSTPVTPGNSAVNVIMTISTTATTTALQSNNQRWILYASWLWLPGIVIGWAARGRSAAKKGAVLFGSISLLLLTLILPACSGVSAGGGGGGGGGHQGTPPGTYKITVTGSSSGAVSDSGQRTQVTLVVN